MSREFLGTLRSWRERSFLSCLVLGLESSSVCAGEVKVDVKISKTANVGVNVGANVGAKVLRS